MITEHELVEKLKDFIADCNGKALVGLYNYIFGSEGENIAFDDVDWMM